MYTTSIVSHNHLPPGQNCYSMPYFVITGDMFSTPPNSPPPRSSTTSSASVTLSSHPDTDHHQGLITRSYEKAVNFNSVWKDDSNKPGHVMPQHVSSPVKQQSPLSPPPPPPTNLLPDYPNVAIVNSSPATIRVGFFDTTVEATSPGELFGTSLSGVGRDEVITTPPHMTNPSTSSSAHKKPVSAAGLTGSDHDSSPHHIPKVGMVDTSREGLPRPRARSIEEADRDRERMYVPALDNTSFAQQTPRKASVTPSQFSVLSVSCTIHAYIYPCTIYTQVLLYTWKYMCIYSTLVERV